MRVAPKSVADSKSPGRYTLLRRKTFATFTGGKDLSRLCLELLSEQKESWQVLQRGYQSFSNSRERNISCHQFSVRLQYNPSRMKSCTANVDDSHAKGKRCFLCLPHLPKDQKGILYRGKYLILCNPMPILRLHFTVSHIDHRPQLIDEPFSDFLQLVADLGPGWTVLYNGPKCGASAPQHLHFQAAPSGQMPVEREVKNKRRLLLVKKIDNVLLYRVKGLGREITLLEANDPKVMEEVFNRYLKALKQVLLTPEEPMVNIAGFYQAKRWRLLVFPRRKHRPDAFFRKGGGRLVVSPGVIDMAGLIVTPLERDFEGLDGATVKAIYREVSLEGKIVETMINAIG